MGEGIPETMLNAGTERVLTCEIVVQGELRKSWSGWFHGLRIEARVAEDGSVLTSLNGPIVDQSALRAVLNKLWDLNLTLLSVGVCEGVD
jgi:hypothetical protein